jgi:hypothetical protein
LIKAPEFLNSGVLCVKLHKCLCGRYKRFKSTYSFGERENQPLQRVDAQCMAQANKYTTRTRILVGQKPSLTAAP